MKRYLILSIITLVLFGFIGSSSAQALRFGLKAGIGMSNLHFSEPTGDSLGRTNYAGIWYDRKSIFSPTFLVGGVLEYDLTKDFLLSSGLNLTPKFSNVEVTNTADYKNEFLLRLLYLQIPVNIHYRAGRFFIGAGGYLGFCTLGTSTNKITTQDTNGATVTREHVNVVFGSNPEAANLKRVDAGVRGEIGYGFKTVRLSVAYEQGLANNVPTGASANGFVYDGKLRHQAFYATLTYYWLAKG